jgi:glycerol kinase
VTSVLAISHRTSGTTAVVVDGGGNLLGMSEQSVGLRHLPGGRVEQDPRDVLASVIGAAQGAMAEARVPVEMVALADSGRAVLAWDRASGRPLTNVIVRPDRRVHQICAALVEHEPVIVQRTGSALDHRRAAAKLAWLRRYVTTEGVAGPCGSWLVHQLTGEFVTDVATAGRSLLTDLDNTSWDPELLELFGLADDPQPAVVPNDAVVGATLAFGGTTLVGGLVVTEQAALIGQGCLRSAEAACTFGTDAVLLVNSGTAAIRSNVGLDTAVGWRIRHDTTYSLTGQVDTVSYAVEWMKQLGYIATSEDMDQVAAPDAGGVLAVPALAGLGAPWWRPEAKACISGMTRFTGVGHVVTAILQGVAAQVSELGTAAAHDLDRPLTRLRVDGALGRCRTLMQSLADQTQIEVEVAPTTHAAALGAAALGRIAIIPGLDLAEAIPRSEPCTTFGPQWSADRAADFRGRWAVAAQSA